MKDYNEAIVFTAIILALLLIVFIIARYTYLIKKEMISQGIYLENRTVKYKYLDIGCIVFGLGIGLIVSSGDQVEESVKNSTRRFVFNPIHNSVIGRLDQLIGRLRFGYMFVSFDRLK